MSEIQAVVATLTSLKTAGDLLNSFLDVQGAIKEQGKIFELQRVIISAHQSALIAQEAQFALLKRINELEGKIAESETWGREKERYKLETVGDGKLAYALKSEASLAEPHHYICPACFQHRKISLLQPFHGIYSDSLNCHECKLELDITGAAKPDGNRVLDTNFDV